MYYFRAKKYRIIFPKYCKFVSFRYVLFCFIHYMYFDNNYTFKKESFHCSLKKGILLRYEILCCYKAKKSADILCWFQWCRKRDLNPHDCNSHTDLNRARLPIPPFLRIKLFAAWLILNAGKGTWTLMTAIVTRTWTVRVCQFRHSCISNCFAAPQLTRHIIQQLYLNVNTFFMFFEMYIFYIFPKNYWHYRYLLVSFFLVGNK